MEDNLPLGGWLVVIFFGGAGAWMFLGLRPINSWGKMVSVLIPAAAGGVAMALAFCAHYKLESLYFKMLGAFIGGLICMPVSRGVLTVTESEAVGWIKQGVKRFFGLKDVPEIPPEEGEA